MGNYLGQICPDSDSSFTCVETPLQAITRLNSAAGGTTTNTLGCEIDAAVAGGVDAAVAAAKEADYVVLLLGISEQQEGEGNDRTSIDLPQVCERGCGVVVVVSWTRECTDVGRRGKHARQTSEGRRLAS